MTEVWKGLGALPPGGALGILVMYVLFHRSGMQSQPGKLSRGHDGALEDAAPIGQNLTLQPRPSANSRGSPPARRYALRREVREHCQSTG